MKSRQSNQLKKIIVDYKKLSNKILNLLVTKYPNGYDKEDIITFKNSQNEIVECVEVPTEDTLYLVKVSKRLVAAMEDYEETEDDNEIELPEELDMQ